MPHDLPGYCAATTTDAPAMGSSMFKRRRHVGLHPLAFAWLCLSVGGSHAAEPSGSRDPRAQSQYAFSNPYYPSTSWKMRLEKDTPVGDARLPRPQDIWYAHAPNPSNPKRFIDYRRTPAANGLASFWDDVYVSQDNNHSFIIDSWQGPDGNAITGIIASMATATAQGPVAITLGANFTSQSTTGMGHDLANALAPTIATERYFYFADCLRSGPAHISYLDRLPSGSTDEYQALLPSIYNSMGSSGSEVAALGKLVLAGGYLPREVKRDMKRAGIYPASLLYIWKAALPYDVPYDDELRHRVAYYSTGDHSDYTGSNQTDYNHVYHEYDEPTHLRNMIRMAQSMQHPPPVAILKQVWIEGGTVVNDEAKTSWLVHQAAGRPVTIRLSPRDSYDIHGLPLRYRMTTIYGDPGTTITQDPASQEFTIVVPGTARLPKGRTTILLIANNGYFDSNPAAVNIYRTAGTENRRPRVQWPADRKLLPGETFAATIAASDPEGFPVTVSRWSGEVGRLAGDRFEWRVPANQPDGIHKAHFIVSDRTAGNSHESGEVTLAVRATVAEAAADRREGPAPLTVRFGSTGSRDKSGGTLTYRWDFDDGTTSTLPDPEHVFANPGFYRVQLAVTGASGTDTGTVLVHAGHDWQIRLRDGWNANAIDSRAWAKADPRTPAFPDRRDGRVVLSVSDANLPDGNYGLESVRDFSPPLYVEFDYRRARAETADSGFRVLDALIGLTPAKGSSPDTEYVAAPDALGRWSGVAIAGRVGNPWLNSRIRLYVTADPNHPGRFRYQGTLTNEKGTALIRLDDRPAPSANKVGIASSQPRFRIDVNGARVYSP